jgi:hypothetical protein
MKKTYVNMLMQLVELTQDVVTSSVVSSYEDEQPDFVYSKDAWGGVL